MQDLFKDEIAPTYICPILGVEELALLDGLLDEQL